MRKRITRRKVAVGTICVTNLTKTTVSLVPYSTEMPQHVLDKSKEGVIIRENSTNIAEEYHGAPLLSIVDEFIFHALKLPHLLMEAPNKPHYFHKYTLRGGINEITFMTEAEEELEANKLV